MGLKRLLAQPKRVRSNQRGCLANFGHADPIFMSRGAMWRGRGQPCGAVERRRGGPRQCHNSSGAASLSFLASSTAAAGRSRTMAGRRRTTMSQEFVGPLTVTSALGVQGGRLELAATLGGVPDTPYVD